MLAMERKCILLFITTILILNMIRRTTQAQCLVNHIPELSIRVKSPDFNQTAEKYYIVGFFPAKLKSIFNRSGFVWIEAAKYAFLEMTKLFKNLSISVNLEFLIFDTCNDINIATKELLDVVLDVPDHNSAFTNCCDKKLSNNIIGIVGPATSGSTNHLLKLLSFDPYPMISYSATSVRFDDKILYPSFLRTIPPDNLQARLIVDLLIRYNWTYVSIIASDNEYGRMGMEELRKRFVKNKICTAVERLFKNDKETELIIKQLRQETLSNVAIVWASGFQTQKFLIKTVQMKLHHNTFILTESANKNPNIAKMDSNVVQGLFSIVPDSGTYSEFEQNFSDMSYKAHAGSNQWLKYFFDDYLKLSHQQLNTSSIVDHLERLPMTKNGNVRNAVYAYGVAIRNFINNKTNECDTNKYCLSAIIKNRMEFVKNYLQRVKFTDLNNKTASFDEQGNINSVQFKIASLQFTNDTLQWKDVGIWNKATGLNMSRSFTWAKRLSVVPISRCGNICQSGFAHKQGSKACCWTCILCQGDNIKPNIGTGVCVACPPRTFANEDHTKCLPLKYIHMELYDTGAIVTYFVLTLNIIITIFFAIVLIIYSKTPVVFSTQLKLSLIQLSFLFALNFTIFVNLGEPTELKCITYCSITPFLTILAIMPTILKTQRLVTVFNAKQRLLRAKKWHTMSKDVLKVVILLSIQGILLVVSYFYFPFKTITVRLSQNVIQVGCDIKLMFYTEIIYLLIIILVCGISAFRARELPTNYNETRVIAYTMFTCSVILVFVFPLYESISDIHSRTLITNFTILLIDFIILVFMYSPKIWIILFRPKLNTTLNFTMDRIRKLNENINEQIWQKKVSRFEQKDFILSPNGSIQTVTPMIICRGRSISYISDKDGYESDVSEHSSSTIIETPIETPIQPMQNISKERKKSNIQSSGNLMKKILRKRHSSLNNKVHNLTPETDSKIIVEDLTIINNHKAIVDFTTPSMMY